MRSTALARSKPQASTRVGNGHALLHGVDGRSVGARRFREVLFELLSTREDRSNPFVTEAQMTLARRAATLAIWCEQADADMANGKAIDIGEYTAATNTLRRVLADAGMTIPKSPIRI